MNQTAQTGTTARILLVEDDELVRRTLKHGMTRAGFEVSEAPDAETARQFVQTSPAFDLAVLDITLPDQSGIKLAEWLRHNAPTPFIILSGNADDTVVRAAIACGALCYLLKPVDIGQVVPVIQGALARGEDIRQLREDRRQIENALNADRSVSVAVGILMYRDGLSEEAAFEQLRRLARSRRVPLGDQARDIINGVMAPNDGKRA
ncbi:response regulator [Thauera sp. CAU 1555]|uniref:Response regulator n=1 Tax=Thauera sedimentorum TaxID=2767595 RepID=A0ABR9B670_9RHOO|nr:response regulator [Thauera sedimentorum]MBC9070936.1 response regulator [Thauera sedimentorum]MBD8501855.1 response regulator [Thauera sedimentorum]